jgi:hypothetical protein
MLNGTPDYTNDHAYHVNLQVLTSNNAALGNSRVPFMTVPVIVRTKKRFPELFSIMITERQQVSETLGFFSNCNAADLPRVFQCTG